MQWGEVVYSGGLSHEQMPLVLLTMGGLHKSGEEWKARQPFFQVGGRDGHVFRYVSSYHGREGSHNHPG